MAITDMYYDSLSVDAKESTEVRHDSFGSLFGNSRLLFPRESYQLENGGQLATSLVHKPSSSYNDLAFRSSSLDHLPLQNLCPSPEPVISTEYGLLSATNPMLSSSQTQIQPSSSESPFLDASTAGLLGEDLSTMIDGSSPTMGIMESDLSPSCQGVSLPPSSYCFSLAPDASINLASNHSFSSPAFFSDNYTPTVHVVTGRDQMENTTDVLPICAPLEDTHCMVRDVEEKENIEDTEDPEWSVTDPTEDISDGYSSVSSRRKQCKWTKDECNRLVEAVMEKGVDNINWSRVAARVGNRTVSQCINKWKNDLSREGRHIRWTPKATQILRAYMNEGLGIQEIIERMPQYSYIQIYQQFQKGQCNSGPWEDWEVEKLIQLRNEGMGFTEIGRNLNNRHYDDVRNTWNSLHRAKKC